MILMKNKMWVKKAKFLHYVLSNNKVIMNLSKVFDIYSLIIKSTALFRQENALNKIIFTIINFYLVLS